MLHFPYVTYNLVIFMYSYTSFKLTLFSVCCQFIYIVVKHELPPSCLSTM